MVRCLSVVVPSALDNSVSLEPYFATTLPELFAAMCSNRENEREHTGIKYPIDFETALICLANKSREI
jgi:hypothetical protein